MIVATHTRSVGFIACVWDCAGQVIYQEHGFMTADEARTAANEYAACCATVDNFRIEIIEIWRDRKGNPHLSRWQ